jgi:hypothetical protein
MRKPPSNRQLQAMKFLRESGAFLPRESIIENVIENVEHNQKMTILKLESENLVLKAEIVRYKVKCESAENDLKMLLATQEIWAEPNLKDSQDFWKF